MTIIDQRSQKGKLFQDVEVGECFLFDGKNPNSLYIRIDNPVNHAVSLYNGSCLIFDDNDFVKPIDVEIYIS